MFWSIRLQYFWILWSIFADKTRWREMLPVCILASLLGALITGHMSYPTSEWSLLHSYHADWFYFGYSIAFISCKYVLLTPSFQGMLARGS